MTSQVLLTIDTELTWRHRTPGQGWYDNLARSYDPAGVGVPYQLEQLRRHGLRACFFVDPMPALLYGVEPVRRMVEPILQAGQEVQLHLHSFWFDLAEGNTPRFDLTDFDASAQRDLIETARDLLVWAGAPWPTAFRSGSYAADAATVDALGALGFSYDSSHNGADHPRPSALPLPPDLIDPIRCGGVIEVPVSTIRVGKDGLRPLQVCALSSAEMHGALSHAADQGQPVATIVCHSFELATRDGRRVNQVVRGRFDGLCSFLAARRDRLPTVTFGDLEVEPRPVGSQPMLSPPARIAGRTAAQLWADARYERPATAATVLGGLPAAAMDLLPLAALL